MQQENEQSRTSPDVGSTLRSVLRRKASGFMAGGNRLAQPFWTLFSDEIVGCEVGQEREDEINEDVSTLFLMFTKHILRYSLTW